MESKIKYRVVLVVLLILLVFFSVRALDSYRALGEKIVTGHSNVESLRGWMSLSYVAKLYDADPACLCQKFNIEPAECERTKLYELTPPPSPQAAQNLQRRVKIERTPIFEKVVSCQYEIPPPQEWMSMTYVSELYQAHPSCVCGQLQIDTTQCESMTVKDVFKVKKQSPKETRRQLDAAVKGCSTLVGGIKWK